MTPDTARPTLLDREPWPRAASAGPVMPGPAPGNLVGELYVTSLVWVPAAFIAVAASAPPAVPARLRWLLPDRGLGRRPDPCGRLGRAWTETGRSRAE